MSIIVYPPDFSGFHEIANATSVQMSVYYNDIGKLILDVPINADNVASLKNGSLLYDTNKKLSYIIKNVKTDTKANRITANGFTTNEMLNSRVIAAPAAITNVESGVYSVLHSNGAGVDTGERSDNFSEIRCGMPYVYNGGMIRDVLIDGSSTRAGTNPIGVVCKKGVTYELSRSSDNYIFAYHLYKISGTPGDFAFDFQGYDITLNFDEVTEKLFDSGWISAAKASYTADADNILLAPVFNWQEQPITTEKLNEILDTFSITWNEGGAGGVDVNRGMPRIATAAPKGLTEETDITLYGKEMLTEIMPVLSAAGLGNRMTWDHRKQEHIFEVYKGTDRTTGPRAAVFSDERGTARDLVIDDDASEFKNVAYVVTEYEETKYMEVVGTATGDNRHEMWCEVSLSKEEDETESQFKAQLPARMRNHGAMELGKQIRGLSFTVTVDSSELGDLYDIGDIVACVSKRFGVRFNARVIGMKYKKDSKSEVTEIILGEPILTKIGEVNLSG